MENIREEGSNDMKRHYFTKLVTEQRRFGGTSLPRNDNLVVRCSPGIFLILRISTLEKRISSNQNGHVFVMVGQGKLGTRNGEAKLKYKATENWKSLRVHLLSDKCSQPNSLYNLDMLVLKRT